MKKLLLLLVATFYSVGLVYGAMTYNIDTDENKNMTYHIGYTTTTNSNSDKKEIEQLKEDIKELKEENKELSLKVNMLETKLDVQSGFISSLMEHLVKDDSNGK